MMHLSGFRKQPHWAGLLLLLFIAGCSPHPGSGTWLPLSEEDSGFSKLEVHYNGRAELYAAGEQEIVWHCFWVGLNENELSLNCTPSNNPEIEEHYQLNVVAKGEAELTLNEKMVGRFSWSQLKQ